MTRIVFGNIDLGNTYYEGSESTSIKFQLNYQGLGLPHYSYERLISLLIRAGYVNPFTNLPDLTCDVSTCRFSRSCENYDWDLAFRFYFKNTAGSQSFADVPLSSFAIDNLEEGTCDLHIQNLGLPSDQSTILGSMFLQNFVAYFENDYSTMTQSVQLSINPIGVIPGTIIGNVTTDSDK